MRHFKRITSALLVVVLLFSFASCIPTEENSDNSSEESIINTDFQGKYKGKIELANVWCLLNGIDDVSGDESDENEYKELLGYKVDCIFNIKSETLDVYYEYNEKTLENFAKKLSDMAKDESELSIDESMAEEIESYVSKQLNSYLSVYLTDCAYRLEENRLIIDKGGEAEFTLEIGKKKFTVIDTNMQFSIVVNGVTFKKIANYTESNTSSESSDPNTESSIPSQDISNTTSDTTSNPPSDTTETPVYISYPNSNSPVLISENMEYTYPLGLSGMYGVDSYIGGLTDNVINPFVANSTAWFGLLNDPDNTNDSNALEGYGDFVFDLGKITALSNAAIYLGNEVGATIPSVKIFISQDTSHWQELGYMSDALEEPSICSTVYVSTAGLSGISARYIKFRVACPSDMKWAFVGEIQIYADGDKENLKPEIPDDEETIPVDKEMVLFSAGMEYTYPTNDAGTHGARQYTGNLTDGVYPEIFDFTSDWFGLFNNAMAVDGSPNALTGWGDFIFDFESKISLAQIRVCNGNDGAYNIPEIIVYVSDDNENWQTAKTLRIDNDVSENGINWYTGNLGGISARYVKISVSCAAAFYWTFISEIEIYAYE